MFSGISTHIGGSETFCDIEIWAVIQPRHEKVKDFRRLVKYNLLILVNEWAFTYNTGSEPPSVMVSIMSLNTPTLWASSRGI
jgi:hypothetical protein